jgi:hypothetical protein
MILRDEKSVWKKEAAVAIYLNLTKKVIEVQRINVEAKSADVEAKMHNAEARRMDAEVKIRTDDTRIPCVSGQSKSY